MSKHQEARAKGKVKMLAAFCTERSSQHEDWGWTFDPKIWYWLKQFKPSTEVSEGTSQNICYQTCLWALPRRAIQCHSILFDQYHKHYDRGWHDLDSWLFFLFRSITCFPISSTNNLHVHGAEMQQKWLERAGHWVQGQLKKAEHAFTTGICCRLMCCKLKQIFLNSPKDCSSQRFYKSISTGPSL